MRKLLLMLIILLAFGPSVEACVGRALNIGVVNSTEGQLLSDLISTLINERTGTTVHTKNYGSVNELYDAVKGKQVDILIENTSRALRLLNKPAEPNIKKAYELVKTQYEKEKGLVWFKPFGFTNSYGEGLSYTAPVLKVEVLSNFPALPRVLEKLAGVINDETYTRLIKSIEAGGKSKKVARDFLKSKKII